MTVALGAASQTALADYQPGMPPNIDPGDAPFGGSPANPSRPSRGRSIRARAGCTRSSTRTWRGRHVVLVRPRARAPVPSNQRLVPLHARTRAVHEHPPARDARASPAATPIASVRPAPTSRSTRSRSPARRWPRRPRRGCSTRATGPARSPATGLSVDETKFITQNNIAVTAAQRHQHRHRRRRRGRSPSARRSRRRRRARHELTGSVTLALRPDHAHPAPERRRLRGQRDHAHARRHARARRRRRR